METYTCKVTKPIDLNDYDLLYHDLQLKNEILYTIYCTRLTANLLIDKGYNLIYVR